MNASGRGTKPYLPLDCPVDDAQLQHIMTNIARHNQLSETGFLVFGYEIRQLRKLTMNVNDELTSIKLLRCNT